MTFTVNSQSELFSVCNELFKRLRALGVPEERAFDGKLVVSELVTNALKHSGGSSTLKVCVKNGRLELTVYSAERFCPPDSSVCSDVFAEGGRGLFLVDSVAAERTFTEDGGIKVLIKF